MKLIEELKLFVWTLFIIEVATSATNPTIFPIGFAPMHGGTVSLHIPEVPQTEPFYCGTTIATAILRYLGLNTSPQRHYPYTCEQKLNRTMKKPDGSKHVPPLLRGGTEIEAWVTTVNSILANSSLGIRRYTIAYLPCSNYHNKESMPVDDKFLDYSLTSNYLDIASVVYNSVRSGMPVALACRGRITFIPEQEIDRDHFIVIRGISIDRDNVFFYYVYPGKGEEVFLQGKLNTLLARGGYLVYHDPNTLGQREDPMETGGNCEVTEGTRTGAEIGGGVGVLAGAVAGAVVGSALPGVGTVVSAIGGAVVTAITGSINGAVVGSVVNAVRGCKWA